MFVGIIIGIIVVLLIILLVLSYVKCPPDMVYLISGLAKDPKIVIGKAALRIPFLQRIDKLTLKIIQIDIKTYRVPTADYINVDVDAVANVRIPNDNNLIRIAARHFLNQPSSYIGQNAQQILEGNMREIIGQMNLVDLVNNKQLFSQKIQENANDDIKNLGLEIVNLNVQSVTDDNNAIEDLGIDNLVKIQKAAKIAKADSEKEIKIAESEADEQGAKARAEADAKIAEQQKDLEIKKAEYKIQQDKKKAEADAAYEIQRAEQQKIINENTISAEIIKREKETELKEKEVALKEKELDALVRKQADADKYRVEQEAEANKLAKIQEAEANAKEAEYQAKAKIELAKANKLAAELEAEGIKAKLEAEAAGKKAMLLAEAEGIRQKGLAEAEGIEKKAEAQAKMKEASIAEMAFKALPEIAKEVSAPLNNIDNIIMYGDQTDKLIEKSTKRIDSITDIARDTLGIDLRSLVGKFADNVTNSKTSKNNKNNKNNE